MFACCVRCAGASLQRFKHACTVATAINILEKNGQQRGKLFHSPDPLGALPALRCLCYNDLYIDTDNTINMATASQMDAGSIIDGLAEKFTRFLGTYSPADYVAPQIDQDGEDGTDAPASFMARTVQEMATNNETTLYVDFKHISDFDYDMADKILQHYERCEPVLRDSLKNYIRQHHEQFIKDAHGPEKEFFVGIHGLHSIDRLRDLRTEHIGRLSAFSGTVTRTSDVRPELFLGTFRCQHCATVVKNVEQFYKFTEPLVCPSASCNNRCGGVP